MSLEIRELIIKATVVPEGGANAGAAASGNGNAAPGEEMINTCVEKILEILKEKNGR
jgi:hypothetical protein